MSCAVWPDYCWITWVHGMRTCAHNKRYIAACMYTNKHVAFAMPHVLRLLLLSHILLT